MTPENNYVSNDDHVYEYVETNTVVTHVGVVNETLCEYVVSNNKIYRLFTKGTQSTNGSQNKITPREDEDFVHISLDVEQVTANKTGNIVMSAEEDGHFCDADTFASIFHLGAIRLMPRLSCILKLKSY